MLPCRRRCQCLLGMEELGSTNIDEIDIWTIEQLVIVVVGSLRAEPVGRTLSDIEPDIGNGDEFNQG